MKIEVDAQAPEATITIDGATFTVAADDEQTLAAFLRGVDAAAVGDALAHRGSADFAAYVASLRG